jgi:hypothetical protein
MPRTCERETPRRRRQGWRHAHAHRPGQVPARVRWSRLRTTADGWTPLGWEQSRHPGGDCQVSGVTGKTMPPAGAPGASHAIRALAPGGTAESALSLAQIVPCANPWPTPPGRILGGSLRARQGALPGHGSTRHHHARTAQDRHTCRGLVSSRQCPGVSGHRGASPAAHGGTRGFLTYTRRGQRG